MSDEKIPRFLQQTTSQLLHQQEALRKRREMLERESTKPPAMRFGTGSPPRSHSRHAKSPVPHTSSSSSSSLMQDRHALQSTPPRGDNVHRELNWSKADEESVAERAPMRFSMTFRPAPTPLAGGRTRAGTQLPVPPSPSPREVNTADQVGSAMRKAAKEVSTPRTASPRSPLAQRTRPEEAVENAVGASLHKARVPVQIPAPATEEKPAEVQGVMEGEDSWEMTRAQKQRSLPPPPPLTFEGRTAVPATAAAAAAEMDVRPSDADVMGITGFSNTFAVPRFTPSTPLAAARAEATKSSAEKSEEESATPGRRAVGEFRTPQPVTRMSTSLTPIVHSGNISHTNANALTEEGEQSTTVQEQNRPHSPEETPTNPADPADSNQRHAASPVPTPSQLLSSVEASTEKRSRGVQTPAMSRDQNAEEDGAEEARRTKSPSHTLNMLSASRSTGLRTPSPTRRTKASPAPTAQNLIQSVQVSAERRPCGCERTTPSPDHWQPQRHQQHRSTPSRPTASPAPTPVPPSTIPMTDFGSATHKCCDRPTPLSLSSQPAGGEARVTAAPSASPWPTTDNIISSILTGSLEEQRRARDAAADEDEEEHRHRQLRSPEATPSAHTPSPVPTERQYGQSVLASAEKRRCGRPTPGDRNVSPARAAEDDNTCNAQSRGGAVAENWSASPQPSAHHLLDSLDVSIGKSGKRGKPAEREDKAEGEERGDAEEANQSVSGGDRDARQAALRTPSPTLTPEHVMASLQASAEKRTRSAAVDMSNTSGEGKQDASSMSDSFQSPTLTAQNVKDSIQKLVTDKQQQQTRSDAQAPHRPWCEDTSSVTYTNDNTSGSPLLTAAGVDASLAALEQEHQRRTRSARAVREWDGRWSTSMGSRGMGDEGNDGEETTLSPQAALAPPPPLAAAPSPAASDFVTASAMFFDCVSAPVTPSLPEMEAVAASTVNTRTAAVPAQFVELQRQVAAISEGRSRTRTPAPLHASECMSPVADDDVTSTQSRVSVGALDTEAQRRSSLLLVHATSSHRAVIQHPHEPMPMMSPPSISPVRVPRTPTPVPPPQSTTQERATQTPTHVTPSRRSVAAAAGEAESPLPRPVTLSSQVLMQSKPLSVPAKPASHPTLMPTAEEDLVGQLDEETTAVQTRPQHHYYREEAIDEEEEADLFDSKNDWMDLTEPLRPHTITVSPQAGSIVYTTHHNGAEGNEDEEAEAHDALPSPPQSRKRSRSACTPPAAPRAHTAAAVGTAMTPASVTLTMDDGTASRGKPSDELTHTPSWVSDSQTPRSTPRGRRSQAEELMAMLPADVVAEVQRLQQQQQEEDEASEDDDGGSSARSSGGSPASRLSALSSAEDDAVHTVVEKSTISQRVSRRQRQTAAFDDSVHGEHAADLGRSGSKTAEVAATARRKDVVVEETSSSAAGESPLSVSASSTPSSASRHSQSESGSNSSGRRTVEESSESIVSPVQAGRSSQLRVATRLSSRLQAAIFRDAPATVKPKKKVSKKAAKKASAGSAKSSSAGPATAGPVPKAKGNSSGKGSKSTRGRRVKKAARKFVTAKSSRATFRRTNAKRKK